MRWQGRRQSDNIEDRRSAGAEFQADPQAGRVFRCRAAKPDWLWSLSWSWPVFTALT